MRLRLDRWLAGLPVSKTVLVVLFVAVGLYLRLNALSSQLLLDDEWHSIGVARHHTLGWLWTNCLGSGASSIPINVYQRAVLCLVGWNETLLRLPNLVCGLGMVLVLPWTLRRVVSPNVVLWFLFFVATSPFLVFYSRNSRPYAIFVLLSFLSVLYTYRWLRVGVGARWALAGLVLTSVLGVHVHLFAVPTVVACFGVGWVALAYDRLSPRRSSTAGYRFRELSVAAILTVLVIGLLYWQPLRNGMLTRLPAGPAIRPSQLPWPGFYQYLCGTVKPVWLIALGALAVTGVGVLTVGEGAGFLGLLGAIAVANVGAVLASHPECVDAPIVFARYCIVIFPAFYVLCAVGGEWLRSRLLSICPRNLCRVLGYGGLAWAGIAYLSSTPNKSMATPGPQSFAMHSAFHESYREPDWQKPYTSQFYRLFAITKKDIPDFYLRVASDNAVRAIVEYPMPVGDHENILYYYQHFHGKRVYVGYMSGPLCCPVPGEQCPPFDSTAEDLYEPDGRQQKVELTNFVDIKSPAAIRRTGATYFVVHKNYFAEIGGEKAVAIAPEAHAISRYLRGLFGAPCYEDSRLWVFGIGGAGR
jgi:hypothetical protein